MRGIRARQLISVMTVAILAVSALLVPTSAQAANVESRGVYIDASGRAGSKIVVTVMSKLVTGSTSTTDTAWAYVSEGPYGVARYDRNFAISAAPIRIVNSVAYFQIVLNSESAGTYTVYAGIRSQDSGLNFAYGWDCGVSCRYTSTAFQVGGTVDRVKFASRNLAISPSLSSNVEDLTPTGLVLFDAEGNRTLLSDDETIQLTTQTAPAGSAPTFAAGNETQLSTPGSSQLAITSASNNGDGIFRFKVGNSTAGITVIQGIVSDSNGAIASSNFQITGTTNAIPGKSVKVLSSNSANESMYASGSDGKLYEWGAHEVGLKDAVTSLDVDKRTLIKPTKIDFPHAASGTSKNSVDQLIRNYDSGWNNYFGHYVLADDGTLWGFRKSGISNEQTLSGNLEPVFTFNLNSNYITQAGGNAKLFLLADGTTLTRDSNWKFSVPDLGSIGNPVITQISYMNGSGVSLFLATDGKLYSSGTNAYGELGQGSDTATALGQVVLPTNRIISKLYAGTRFGVVKMVDGSYWSWGDNRGGQQGKLASEVPYSNTPRVVITPANFSVNDIQVDKQIVLIGTSQFYTSYNGNWQLNLAANAGLPNGSQISAFSGDGIDEISYSYINGYLIADNSGNVYQYGGPTGSCGNNYGRIRSYGQFGETFLGDNVQSGSKFYIDSSTTSQISGAISVKVNTPFSLQVANVRTSCYQTSELSFAWDKDGNSTFETPDIATVGDTGYFGLNASLNFSTPGRRKITLGVTTPDEITLQVPFTIGVEPETRTVLSAIDTSTATIVSDGGTTIALTKSGGVYAWGANDFGQLGVSPSLYTRRNIPMPLSLPDTATPASVAVQNGNTLVVDTLGRVWGFGIANSIDGTSGTYTSARQVTSLKSVKVRLIKDNFVLTTDGKLLVWNPNDRSLVSIPSLAGIYIRSFAYQGYIQGCGATPTQMSRNLLNAVDTDGKVWRVPLSINFIPGDAEAISIQNAIEIKGYGSKAVIKASNEDIYFSSYAGCDFGLVTKPAGTTMLDVAPYSRNSSMIAMTDTSRNVWTASIEQGTGVFQPGTWTKLAAIDAVRTSSSDTPTLFASAPNYIGFASERVFTTDGDYYTNGTCGTGTARLYSTGQFGSTYFSDSILLGSSTAFVGSNSPVAFTSGQTLAGENGDNLVFKLTNPRSSCFTGASQLTASADLDGNGTYETVATPTNESGTYSFIITATAPSSGRRTYSFKVETPIGTSKIFTVNVGIYGSSSSLAVTARSKVFNTGGDTSIAIGTDGYAYAWGGAMNFMNILTTTPPRTTLKPTKVQIPGNPQIIDGATYSNWDYDQDYGLLVVDASGKVWSWGTRRNMDAPSSTFALGDVPITPTQVSSLSNVVVKRISVSSSGQRTLALSNSGNVYQWDSNNRTPTLVPGLAGITIKNIWASNDLYAALSTSGELYTWGGYGFNLGRMMTNGSGYYWETSNNPDSATITDPIADVSAGLSKGSQLNTALTTTGKLFSWGNFKSSQVYIPEQTVLPGGRTPVAIGSNGYTLLVFASDKTWWTQALDVNRNITYYQVNMVSADISNTFSEFSEGTGTGFISTNSNLYTFGNNNPGTCGPVGSLNRVMSDGQFGSIFADDSIDIQINGNDISRPIINNYFEVIASSRCFGATGVTVSTEMSVQGTVGEFKLSTAQDGSSITSYNKYYTSVNGPLTITVRATNSAGVVATQSFYTLVVPLPPAGRQIGVSINSGARYANSSNVLLDLVWPDGVYKIYVSNDGGFAPGTVTEIDLQSQISWVLPPQAVIPLPSIVYARFGDSTAYYFDDIILDAISPVLTFAAAK